MKKRGAIYSVVALMLCVAVYLNWYYSKGDPLEEGQQQADGKVLGESVLVDGVAGADPLEQAEQTAGLPPAGQRRSRWDPDADGGK